MIDKSKKLEYGDFQTPLHLAEQVCCLLLRERIRPRTTIEPTCGNGAFLESALGTYDNTSAFFGFDINPDYVNATNERLIHCCEDKTVDVKVQDFFTFDWSAFISQQPHPILFLGNLPWVTSSVLGIHGSSNTPIKSNIKSLNGLGALTGKSNFDISEWMMIELMQSAGKKPFWMAFICKSSVARKFLEYCWKKKVNVSQSRIYKIDAAKWFGVSVDACLFLAAFHQSNPDQTAQVYDGIVDSQYLTTIGFVENRIVSDTVKYESTEHLRGTSSYRWRSGVKHDLSKIMEFTCDNDILKNGFGEVVDIEEICLYPLLKSTDISKGHIVPKKKVLLTQTHTGDNTSLLEKAAPKTWAYLLAHDVLFSQRKALYTRKNVLIPYLE